MNKPVDFLISFDTTGSMYSCLLQVRRKAAGLVELLFSQNPDIRIGVIAHGDYCDTSSSYLSKILDLTDNKHSIMEFIQNVGSTAGGSFAEAYEHVLWQARALTWRAGSERAFVMIGDAVPHHKSVWGTKEAGHVVNPKSLDWENEAKVLHQELGVKIFGVHALASARGSSSYFWKSLAELTGGKYLKLDQFDELSYMLRAIMYNQSGQDEFMTEFVNEITYDKQMTQNMADIFEDMTGSRPEVNKVSIGGGGRSVRVRSRARTTAVATTVSAADLAAYPDVSLVPVDPGRFQMLSVDSKAPIRDFVRDNVGATLFKKGAGYYQLGSKAVRIQSYKKVVLVDRETGELWSGDAARKMLGLPFGKDFKLFPGKGETQKFLSEYDVFVQSTSVNRALQAGDVFLYEIAEFAA